MAVFFPEGIVSELNFTFGIKASPQRAAMDDQRRIWQAADDGGFDSCWVFDHLMAMGRDRNGDICRAGLGAVDHIPSPG